MLTKQAINLLTVIKLLRFIKTDILPMYTHEEKDISVQFFTRTTRVICETNIKVFTADKAGSRNALEHILKLL